MLFFVSVGVAFFLYLFAPVNRVNLEKNVSAPGELSQRTDSGLEVGFIRLAANREAFSGKRIRVVGWLYGIGSWNHLYMLESAHDPLIPGLFLRVSMEKNKLIQFSNGYVMIEGDFLQADTDSEVGLLSSATIVHRRWPQSLTESTFLDVLSFMLCFI